MIRLAAFIIAALIVVAAVLRIAGIYDDFWLDEIWSGRIAGSLSRPWHVLTHPNARYDNNHPLNTLLMWAMGHPGWPIFRLPALAAGIGSVIVATITLRRRGPLEALVGAVLVGFSYPLILYSSEARGYSLVIFFALVAFDAMDRYLQSRAWISNIVFVIACVLGFFSHLTFLHFYAGVLTWSLCRWIRHRRGWLDAIRCHVIPIATLGFLYFVFVRHLTIGGAPVESRWRAIVVAVGGLLGAGDSLTAAIPLIGAAGALFVMSLLMLYRRADDLWLMLLVTVVISPIVVVSRQLLFVQFEQPIHARYFLVAYTFGLIAITMLLSEWLRRGLVLRLAGAAVIAAFLAVNLWHTSLFLRIGRGHYLDAIAIMSARTPSPFITVLSDHPLRTAMVLDFYRDKLSPHQQLIIYDGAAERANFTHGPPLWIIVHSNERGKPPEQFQGYVFDRELPYYGLSGYSWYLYRMRSIPPG